MPTAQTRNNALTLRRLACTLVSLVAWSAFAAENQIRYDDVSCDFHFLRDSARQKQLADIEALGEWSALNLHDTGWGYTKDQIWIRVSCQNYAATAQKIYLEIKYSLLDHVQVFHGTESYAIGDRDIFENRPIKHRNPIIPIDFQAQAKQTVYLRVSTDGSMEFPFSLRAPPQFANETLTEYLLLGFYYGTMLSLLIYNFFLFITIRERVYLFYVAYVLSFACFQFSINGLTFSLLHEHGSWLQNEGLGFIMPVIQCLIFLFARDYLKLKTFYPRHDTIAKTLALVLFLLAGASLFMPYSITNRLGAVQGVIVAIYVSVIGSMVAARGFAPARYFMLAWTVYLIGVLLISLKTLGILAPSFYTNNAIQIGSGIEILLLSLGLGHRVKAADRERANAEKKATALATLNQVMQMVAHDIRKPFSTMNMALHGIQDKSPSVVKESILEILPRIRISINHVNNLMNDILYTHRPGDVVRVPCSANRIISNVLISLEADINAKSLTLSIDLEHRSKISADADKMERALMNLVVNAIEATQFEGKIWIQSREDAARKQITFTVGNSDSFITPKDLPHIFTPFYTKGKTRGTGMGLAIVEKIIKEHGASIRCTSEKSRGTKFFFSIAAVESELDDEAGPKASATRSSHAAESGGENRMASANDGDTRPLLIVIDDDAFICEYWRRDLPNFSVLAYTHTSLFLAALEAGQFAIDRVEAVIADFYLGREVIDLKALAIELQKYAIPLYLSTDAELDPAAIPEGVKKIGKNPEEFLKEQNRN